MDKQESRLAQTAKGVIEYTLKGAGPVILYLHGTSCNCRSDMGHATLLEAGFSILTPSRPGYGRTPVSAGETASQAAGAMAALLDYLRIESVSVIAVSAGGPTGLNLAADYPGRIERLVLESAVSKELFEAGDPRYGQMRQFYGPFHALSWFMLEALCLIAPRAMARQTMAIFSTHDTGEAMQQLSAEDVGAIKRFYLNGSSATGALLDCGHTVPVEVLARIAAPTLIVHTREDKRVPFAHAEHARRHIPGSVLYTAETFSHFLSIGPGANAVDRRVVEFLRGH